jgi:hypothetical protein
MNRLQMAEEIEQRVPVLVTSDADRIKEAKQLHLKFIKDYSLGKISRLEIDEYVVGKGAQDTFCYRLEFKMECLGQISGTPSRKYGVFHSKKRQRYEATVRYGREINQAFVQLKQDLWDLINAAENDDLVTIAASSISPMFKGKLLFLYAPEKFAPIYSKRHLKHFVAALNLPGTFDTEWEMQRALMDYRAGFPMLKEQSPILYMQLLYDLFDYPRDNKFAGIPAIDTVPLLNKAVEGAEFINEMPPTSPPSVATAVIRKAAKSNFERRQRKLKLIGDRGEAIVVELEKDRLIKAGKKKLAAEVKHVSQEDDTLGYDILSYDDDGTVRYIEVKATTGKNLDRGFFVSANEFEKAKSLSNYYFYFVFSTMTANPRILRYKEPTFKGSDFVITPVSFHVTLSATDNS